MRDLLPPEDFFDGDLSVHGSWLSKITGLRRDIPVIWTNDPYEIRPDHEGSRPMIEVHDSFAAEMRQEDEITIEAVRYRVRHMDPFDSEGYAQAELMNDDTY